MLQALTTVADGLTGKLDGYTTTSVTAFTQALAAAKTVLADPNHTPEQLKAASDALLAAMSALELKAPVIDKTVMQHVYDEANGLSNSSGRYTSASWATLQTELTQASAVLGNASATQVQVDDAAKELASAVSGLEISPAAPDKSVLRNVRDAAAAVSNDGDVYTAASWSALQSALADAAAVIDDATATQAEIDEAASDLTAALSGLVLKPVPVNLGVLRNATSVAGTMSNADDRYTAASWAALQQALTTARQVADDATATQAEVDEAASSLNAAVAGLVLNPPKVVEVPVGSVPTVTKLTLNQVQARVVKGKTLDIDEAVDYSDGLPSAYSGKVVWTSSNTRVATVSSRGEVTGKATGVVTITATTIDKTAAGKTLSAKITVTVVKSKPKSKVTSITASIPKTMTVGQVVFAKARYASSKTTGVKITYSSSRYAVVDVDRVGRLIAVGKGTATITIKAGGKTKTWKVTVK